MKRTSIRGGQKYWVCLAVFALMLVGMAPAPAQDRVTVLHVFLAAGQSNMSGRGLPSGAAQDPVDPRIFEYGAKHAAFRSAKVPLDMHDHATGLSPATTFAREYLKNQPGNVGVLIIPAAHGGTGFSNVQRGLTWYVGAASDPGDDLPALAVRQTRQGIAAARTAGYGADLKGILWHQGENDSWLTTSQYSTRLDALIAFFRTQLDAPKLPFVVGQMAPEGIAATPGRINVDRSHRQTPARVEHTGFAFSMTGGVNSGDLTHFSRTGVEYLGKTYLSGYRQAAQTYPGQAVSIFPTRILDTRSSSAGRVAGGGAVSLPVAGVNGVPANVSAVVVNVTVTEPASFGFITAHASGTAKPNTSNVNYGAGQTVANLAVVPVGADGKVTLSNTSSGSVHLIADVSAYFHSGTPSAPGAFRSLAPYRFLDTRLAASPVTGGSAVSFQVGGLRGIPANASAVVMNITVTEPASFGFLAAHASETAKPGTSNVNYGAGQTVPNLAVVPVGRDGKVTIWNRSSGPAHIVADVSGYFLSGTPERAGAFAVLAPTRFLDTRSHSAPVSAGDSVALQVAGVKGVPPAVAAVVVNLTVTKPRSFGFLTAFASGTAHPNTSNVNYGQEQTVPNLAVVPVGTDGKVQIANTSAGAVHVVVDVFGYILK